MNIFLKWFYIVWFGLVLLLNLLGVIGTAITTKSFFETLSWLQETYSPFNIWTHLLNIILCLPGLGAYIWLKKRKSNENQQTH